MKSDIFQVQKEDVFKRLDNLLVVHYKQKTRSYFQKLITEGHVLVNDKKAKAGMRLKPNDKIKVHFPASKPLQLKAKPISLDIVYEDEDILVINKSAGLVMHPGTHGSHIDDSLVNAILYHCKGQLSSINGVLRPGIVHRLDKDTSGLVIVTKNEKAQLDLSAQFKARTVKKTYCALVVGHLIPKNGLIEAPIARDRRDRKKMAVSADPGAKEALTRYKVLEYFKVALPKPRLRKGVNPLAPLRLGTGDYSFVEITLLTGRTHQIRVHFAAIGFFLVGDKTYGRDKINTLFEELYGLQRQFLHAQKISFILPKTQKAVTFETPLPADIDAVFQALKGLKALEPV